MAESVRRALLTLTATVLVQFLIISSTSAQDDLEPYTYYGCLQDVTDFDRTLAVRVDEGDNSIEACANATGDYWYFGLEAGGACWAGDDAGQYGTTDDSECYLPCNDNSSEICGGDYALSTYQRSFIVTTPTASPSPVTDFSVSIDNAYDNQGYPTVLVCDGFVNVSYAAPDAWDGVGTIGIYFGDTSQLFIGTITVSSSEQRQGSIAFDILAKLGIVYFDDSVDKVYLVVFYVDGDVKTSITFRFSSGGVTLSTDTSVNPGISVGDGSDPDQLATEKVINVGWTANSACGGPDIVGIFEYKARPSKATKRMVDDDLADFIAFVNPEQGGATQGFTIKNLNPDVGFEDPVWAAQYFINVRGAYIFGAQSRPFQVITADRTVQVAITPGYLGKPCLSDEKKIWITLTAPANRANNDWVAVFDNSADALVDERIFRDFAYVPANGRTSGVVTIPTTTLRKGRSYAVRYLLADGYWSKAVSGNFELCPKDRTIQVVTDQSPKNGVTTLLSPNMVYLKITMPADHSPQDWIAVYQKDSCDSDNWCFVRYADVLRVNQTTAVIGLKSNRFTAGVVYYAKYNLNDGYTVAASSQYFTFSPAFPGMLPDPGNLGPCASAFGDPHYRTFDRQAITYPGCGTQVLVRPKGSPPLHSFHLQAIQSRPVDMAASIITSIALQCSKTAPIVILTADGSKITLQVGGKADTVSVGTSKQYPTGGLSIAAQKQTVTVTCKNVAEVMVRLQVPSKSVFSYLDLASVKLDWALYGQVEGLLGTWDGDANNDVGWANGTVATKDQATVLRQWIYYTAVPALTNLITGLQNSWSVGTQKGLSGTPSLFPTGDKAPRCGKIRLLTTKALGDGRKLCSQQLGVNSGPDFDACIFDYAATRDLQYVSNSKQSAADFNAFLALDNTNSPDRATRTPSRTVSRTPSRSATRLPSATATRTPTKVPPTPSRVPPTATRVPTRSAAPTRRQ